MKGLTHCSAGVITGVILSTQLSLPHEQALAATICTALGSLLPDIDICTSKLGRLIAPISFTVQLIAGHRNIFHSLLPYILCAILGYRCSPAALLYILAAGAGVLSHLFLDMFNPAGIPLLWPWPKRFHIASFRSGGIVDWLLGIALTLLAAFLILTQYHLDFPLM